MPEIPLEGFSISPEILKELPPWILEDPYLLRGEDVPTVVNPVYKKQEPVTAAQIESINQGEILYEDDETQIISPENPLVPSSEGTHLRVISRVIPVHPKTPQEWYAWLRHTHKVFGAAKVLTEGAPTEDLWTNVLWGNKFAPDEYVTTDIIGRRLTGDSWGATVPMPAARYDQRSQRISDAQQTQLGKTIEAYFRQYWLPEMDKVDMFRDGFIPISPVSPDFGAKNMRDPTKPYFWRNELLVTAGKHEVVAVTAAHVPSGIHLMLNITDAPKRPWQDLAPAFESMVIAEASAQVLTETLFDGRPLAARAYVRATGSWLSRWEELRNDPEIQSRLDPATAKAAKRRLRGVTTTMGEAEKLKTSFHPHVLGVEFADEDLAHRLHSIDKGEPDWQNGRHINSAKMQAMRDALNDQLPSLVTPSQGMLTL